MTNTTRFAPSPTGHLHIGGARTALLSWLFAQKLNGQFVLRIEDTDTARSKQEYTDSILQSLSWLDLKYDNTPIHQSDRYAHYQKIAHQLVQDGKAYYCYTTPDELNQKRQAYKDSTGHDGYQYDRFWRDNTQIPPQGIMPSIRIKSPLDGFTQWKDIIKGKISIPNQQIDDFVILRSDGSPTYNFCVVVDDADMGITHVIRGDDHINNTPKQIQIYQALNKDIPFFGHVPLILNMDGSKQSKRVAIDVSDDSQILPMTHLNYYQDKGFLPDAIMNYLLLISCNHVSKEVFTKVEFVDMFSFDKLGKTPIKFDLQKLIWLNQQHIKKLNTKDFQDITLSLIHQNINQFNDSYFLQTDSLNWQAIQKAVCDRSKTTHDFIKILQPLTSIKDNYKNYPDFLQSLSSWADDTKTSSDYLVFLKNYAKDNKIDTNSFLKDLRLNLFNNCIIPIHDVLAFIGPTNLEICQSKKHKI